MSELYMQISQCLDSEPYAGKEFSQRAYQWLEDSQDKSPSEITEGWAKLHAEYERLSQPYWCSVWKRIEDAKIGGLKQGDLFA